MSMFVLIALAAAEVALVWMTCTKWCEKPDWRRNRALVRLTETALMFGIVLLPTTHMKWRFLIALVMLIVRFLIAGISWLAGRKKTGTRRKGWTVVNCVFSVILIAFTLILTASVIIGNIYAPEQVLHYADLLAPVRTAAWCVLPNCVTYFRKEPSLKQYLLRLMLQLILIQTEVMLLIAPPADGSVSPVRFYCTPGVTVCVIYAAVMLMLWLQKVRQSRKLTQQLIDFQNGQTE